MEVPGWLLIIKNDTLRAEFLNVWQRLPYYVRPPLTLDTPAVHLVDDQDTAAKTRVSVNHENGATALGLITVPPALSRRPLRPRAGCTPTEVGKWG